MNTAARSHKVIELPSEATIAKWLEPEEFVYDSFQAKHKNPDSCPKCGSINLMQRIQVENKTVRLYCGDCGRYIKFITKTPEQERRVELIDQFFKANPGKLESMNIHGSLKEKEKRQKRNSDNGRAQVKKPEQIGTPDMERFVITDYGNGVTVIMDKETNIQYLAYGGGLCPMVDGNPPW